MVPSCYQYRVPAELQGMTDEGELTYKAEAFPVAINIIPTLFITEKRSMLIPKPRVHTPSSFVEAGNNYQPVVKTRQRF